MVSIEPLIVIVSPSAAIAIASRSDPTPESAVVETTRLPSPVSGLATGVSGAGSSGAATSMS